MGARIITKYNSNNHDSSNGYLHLNFDKIGKENIHLEMEIVGISAGTEAIWLVYSNNELLDTNDLTRGKFAEFIMLKSYAGSPDCPHIFAIMVKDTLSNIIARLDISVYATPKITEAYWGDSIDQKIYEVAVNHRFTAYFKGFGLYNIPLTIRFFLKSADNNDVEITDFAKILRMTSEYDLNDFYVDKEMLKDNYQFFLRNAPAILLDYISEKNLLAIIGKVKNTVIAKSYFTISYGNKILFHGKDQNKLLNIVFNITSFLPPEKSTNISPVTVYSEQYFTQKYEPCKYEKIFFKNGDNPEEEIFDEKKPIDNVNRKKTLHVSAIVPPRGSKNIKEMKIRLDAVKTDDCSFSEKNKKKTNFSEDSKKEEEKPHKGRVINAEALDEANIEYAFKKIDEEIIIKPSFDYKYNKDSAWEFLKNYFLFSAALRNTDVLENEIKGYLMDAEAESKVIKKYKIPLNTCRYQKPLHLKTHADVAWAFHALFDDPYVPEYYIFGNQKTIKTVQGLDEDLDKLKESSIVTNFTATIINPSLGNSFVRNFIIEIIKDIAERYEFGFTAYYDFDKEGKKNAQQIDYAETHPEVFKALIAGVVTLEILIDVLLIILTEGAALANFVSKAGKVAGIINKSSKLAKTGKKAGDILAKHSDTFDIARNARMAKNAFEFMKGSYFKGYRFVEDVEIGVQPVLEERVKISPFLNLNVTQKKSLGELLLDKTPVGMTLNMAKAATGGFGLGVSAMFLRKIKVRGKEVGKQGVGWYLALTYPLKISNYAVSGVYSLLAFATDEALREVFGTEAEFEKDITSHIDLDFWLKIHNAEKKLDLFALKKGESKTDKSEISIAPSGAFTVRLKLSGSVSNNVIVRAMHMLTWNNKEEAKMQEMTAEGKFEVEGNVFIERRYYYKADKKPYHEDKIVFTGLAGEYEYKVKTRKRDKDTIKKEEVIKNQEPKQFMLMEPCQLVFNSDEMTKNPSEDK